jgi:Uma2 family endonuclease
MSEVTTQPNDLSLADFLIWEERQETKHEFVAGSVVAFAGGTTRHHLIAAEILAAAVVHVRGSECLALGSDALIETATSARHPDVVVTCDGRDTRDLAQRTIRYPKLIVEVLCESTAALDRGAKLDEYRTLETLEEYVLIDSRRRWLETYRRLDGAWVVSLPVARGSLRLESIGATLDLDDLYERAGVAAPEAPGS